MNRLARWMMRLYPTRWRKRYGDELDALLSDTGADARSVVDLFKGALRMQFSTWSFPRLAAVLGLTGMAVGVLVSLLTPASYVARIELPLTGADSAVATMQMLRSEVTSRMSLSTTIRDRRVLLYEDQIATSPMEDVIGQMRSDVAIDLANRMATGTGGVTSVAIQFTYPDPVKARLTTEILAEHAAETLRMRAAATQVPGKTPFLDIVDVATLPVRPLRPDLRLAALTGLAAGLSFAVLWLAIRLRRASRKPRAWPTVSGLALAGAAAGLGVACLIPANSWLIPEGTIPLRYQSHATLYAEEQDAATPGELLLQIASRTALASIIADPHLLLYRELLSKHEPEDVAETMRADLVVAGNSGSGGRWIDISFTYPDRFKCRQTVQTIVSRLEEAYQKRKRERESPAPVRPTKWGSIVVDNSPPVAVNKANQNSVSPLSPVLSGLLAGLSLAVLIVSVRHRWTPEGEEAALPQRAGMLRFDSQRFRKLAPWLTAAGAAAGIVGALRMPVRYTSDALISFEER